MVEGKPFNSRKMKPMVQEDKMDYLVVLYESVCMLE